MSKHLGACGISMVIATGAQAGGLGSMIKNRVVPANSALAMNNSCTSFKGSWVGTCTDQDGKTADESMTISQSGCHRMEFDGYVVHLDSFSTDSTSSVVPESGQRSDDFSQASSEVVKWSKDRTSIRAEGSFFARFSKSQPFMTGFKQFIRMDGEQLKIDSKLEEMGINFSCTYSRK